MAKVKMMEQDATKKQWLENAYSQQAMDILGRMMGGMQNCMQHPGIQEVFKKLERRPVCPTE